MATQKPRKEKTTDELLRDLIIIQLCTAGLTQRQIRDIVNVDMSYVNRIAKHFKKVKNDK
ncbi:MAG: hypothetical protein WDZ90_01545 [Candidatus Paceibacterota bacterium]